jgi:spore maturation protein CgeB
MSLNVSRGSYQKLYSSDRISSLIGNGLLVFINKNTEFKKLFTNNEVVYYGDKKDLANKIKYFLLNDKTRIKFAKSAYYKYHKHMNNKIVTSYMINCVSHKNFKKPFWDNLN